MKQDLNEEVVTSMFKLAKALKKFTNYQGNEEGLSSSQLQTLMFVKDNQTPTMSQISTHFDIALPTATAMVERLVKGNLLKRVADESDRRIIRVETTEQGEDVFIKCINIKKDHVKKLFLLLSQEDRQTFNRIINDLLNKIEKVQDEKTQ